MKPRKTNPRTFLRWYLRGVILMLGIFCFALGLFLWQAYLALWEPGSITDRLIILTAMIFAAYFCWLQVCRLFGVLSEVGGNLDGYAEDLEGIQKSRSDSEEQ